LTKCKQSTNLRGAEAKSLELFSSLKLLPLSSSISFYNERAIFFATQSDRRNFIVHVTSIYHKNAILTTLCVPLSDGKTETDQLMPYTHDFCRLLFHRQKAWKHGSLPGIFRNRKLRMEKTQFLFSVSL
jgi:hypothetical protein